MRQLREEDTRRLNELLDLNKRRKHELEKQRTTHGFETDAHIRLEIEDINADIRRIEAALQGTGTSETLEALGDTGRYLALSFELKMIDQRHRHMVAYLDEKINAKIDELIAERRRDTKVTKVWLIVLSALIAIILFVLTVEITLRF